MSRIYKYLFIFLITSIIISIGIYLIISYKYQNTIIIDKNNLITILEDAHDNIDLYVGKKIKISGYIYMTEDFQENRFVIAQNVALDPLLPSETFIVGFLCENNSGHIFSPNETIEITGKIIKGIYNDIEYPIIQFKDFRFIPYIQTSP